MIQLDSTRNVPLRNQRVTFLTQHGKENIVGPIFEAMTNHRIELVTGFDTDLLGTFSRDVPRAGSQLEAARRKCRMGMELGKCSVGIASEGAFVSDPFIGLMPWNMEMIVFIDDAKGLEVIGLAQGTSNEAQQLVTDVDSLKSFANQATFPSHQLMLRPNDEDDARIFKGLSDWSALCDAFQRAKELSTNGKVFVESDLRAFCNPTRQAMIRSAAEDLARKLNSECPHCGSAGFWITGHVSGLRCSRCQGATKLAIADVWSCAKCAHREERIRATAAYADPSKCDNCNP